jgi:hypothetical protein
MASLRFRLRFPSLAVATACLMIPASARAQQVGVKGGINFAKITPPEDEEPNISRHLGPVGGVWVRFAPARRVSAVIEGLFAEKGVIYNIAVPDLNASVDLRVRYVEIPVLARVDLGAAGSTTRPYVVGGAAPAFKLSARAKARSQGQEQSQDVDDEIYSTDVGLAGGVGVEIGRALIEARYTHGLRHINTDDNGDEDRNRNRVFSVTAGFRFR